MVKIGKKKGKIDGRGVVIAGTTDNCDRIKDTPKGKQANTEGTASIQPSLGKGRKKSGSVK